MEHGPPSTINAHTNDGKHPVYFAKNDGATLLNEKLKEMGLDPCDASG